MTAGRCLVLAVHMRRWDLFWLGPNKVTIFRSLLGLTASALSNLAAVCRPSQELLLPCGTQLHHELVNSLGARWSQSGRFGCFQWCWDSKTDRIEEELASEMRIILSVSWQVPFLAASGGSHSERYNTGCGFGSVPEVRTFAFCFWELLSLHPN